MYLQDGSRTDFVKNRGREWLRLLLIVGKEVERTGIKQTFVSPVERHVSRII